MDDLEHSLYNIALTIDSPSGAYFFINNTTKTFYRDKRDEVVWRLDEKTGYVCTTDSLYVAKSLPEFLSHLLYDANTIRDIENIDQHIPCRNKSLHGSKKLAPISRQGSILPKIRSSSNDYTNLAHMDSHLNPLKSTNSRIKLEPLTTS